MVVQLVEWLFIWLNCCSSGWMVVHLVVMLVKWLFIWLHGCYPSTDYFRCETLGGICVFVKSDLFSFYINA